MVSLCTQGNEMDASRGIMSGTMDRFKMVSKLELALLSHLAFHFLSPITYLLVVDYEFRITLIGV